MHELFVYSADHDECLSSHHGCEHKCNNFHGSFFCSCNTGYALNRDNKTCSGMAFVFKSLLNPFRRTIPPNRVLVCARYSGIDLSSPLFFLTEGGSNATPLKSPPPPKKMIRDCYAAKCNADAKCNKNRRKI